VSEGSSTDVRLMIVGYEIGDLGNEERKLRELREMPVGRGAQAELQLQVRNDHAQVRIATALTVAVDGSLYVAGSAPDGSQAVRHAAPGVVVSMNANAMPRRLDHAGGDFRHLPGQAPAVRLAEHDGLCAAADRGPDGLHRVARVGREAVEEVLRVVDHTAPGLPEKGDALLDQLQVLVERDPEHVAHVQCPALAENGAGWGSRVYQGLEVRIVLRKELGAPRGPKRRDAGMAPFDIARLLEELGVLWIREGPAPFDEIDTESVEALGDAKLVSHGVRDTLTLRSIPQRRVVNLYPAAGGWSGSVHVG
jgi:hypothetical protein